MSAIHISQLNGVSLSLRKTCQITIKANSFILISSNASKALYTRKYYIQYLLGKSTLFHFVFKKTTKTQQSADLNTILMLKKRSFMVLASIFRLEVFHNPNSYFLYNFQVKEMIQLRQN